MGGKSGSKVPVTEFRLSIHFGICHGPIDSLNALIFGEKTGWSGEVADPGVIAIRQEELFGGPFKEGGVLGNVYYLPGDDAQTLPQGLATRLGLTSDTAPGYRGVSSIFFVGGSQVGSHGTVVSYEQAKTLVTSGPTAGFVWAHNSPYLKGMWVNATRIPTGLDPNTATIEYSDTVEIAGPQANPAHVIYECYTNTDWGAGESPLSINTESFQEAATTLFNEDFGISLFWSNQTEVEDFISDVLSHIQAVVFVNPRDGLLTLKLLRGDYDEENLPEFDETNSRVSNPARKLQGESINEVQVKWMNPANEQQESITLQDLGSVIAQGGVVVTTTRQYLGIRNVDLATRICTRDLRSAVAPLATADIECDRSAWDLVPGAVIRVFSQEHCMNGVIFRVLDIDYGQTGDPTIKCKIIEDIFSFSSTDYIAAPSTRWGSSATPPTPVTNIQSITLPAFLVNQQLREGLEPPDTFVGVLASHDDEDAQGFEMQTLVVNLNGTSEFVPVSGNFPMVGRTTLSAPLLAEAESLNYAFENPKTGIVGPGENRFALIGEGEDADMEIAFIPSMSGDNADLSRGALDTVPRAWPVGTPVWFFGPDTAFADPAVRVEAVETQSKILTTTSQAKLEAAVAPETTYTPTARPHLPARPADVKINGIGFQEP